VREAARSIVAQAAQDPAARAGAEAFMTGLARRDFAHHMVFGRPGLLRDAPPGDPNAAERWREGRSGIAASDDAIGRLEGDGWLTHSERVAAASGLTQLGGDPRAGAAHFMRRLVDADVALNLAGWAEVYAAATGATDPLP
jgi:deoxyribodipyrimidine photo-lyase